MSKVCKKCQTENNNDAKFCKKCGNAFDDIPVVSSDNLSNVESNDGSKNLLIICVTAVICVIIVAATFLVINSDDGNSAINMNSSNNQSVSDANSSGTNNTNSGSNGDSSSSSSSGSSGGGLTYSEAASKMSGMSSTVIRNTFNEADSNGDGVLKGSEVTAFNRLSRLSEKTASNSNAKSSSGTGTVTRYCTTHGRVTVGSGMQCPYCQQEGLDSRTVKGSTEYN